MILSIGHLSRTPMQLSYRGSSYNWGFHRILSSPRAASSQVITLDEPSTQRLGLYRGLPFLIPAPIRAFPPQRVARLSYRGTPYARLR
jgi:hypothetical protein